MTKINGNTVKGLKTFGLIIALGALPLAAGLTGCAGNRYTQSTGEHIDDKSESARVRTALSNDVEYKFEAVKVQTFKGVVQLSGFVNSREQKSRAGEIAKRVQGVNEVENNITVKETR